LEIADEAGRQLAGRLAGGQIGQALQSEVDSSDIESITFIGLLSDRITL
jgi:hypothetical protein